MVRLPRPEAWNDSLDDETIEVLPLVDDLTARREPGWCTYVYEHVQARIGGHVRRDQQQDATGGCRVATG